MMFRSIIEQRGQVLFPPFMAERVYMREIRKGHLPSDLSRWEQTVDQMLDGIDTDGPIYLMIDQGVVKAGSTHRREGIHIDGYWNPVLSAHGYNGHTGGHLPMPSPSHGGHRGSHSAGNSWLHADFKEPEGLILASDIPGCMGYVGEFPGPVGDGGDCSHVDLSSLDSFLMGAGTVYAGNVTSLHESIPLTQDCQRTLVRLNVPGWTPVLN